MAFNCQLAALVNGSFGGRWPTDLSAQGAQTYSPDPEIEVLKQCKYLIGVMIFAVDEEKNNGIIFFIIFVPEEDKAKNIWRRIIYSLWRRWKAEKVNILLVSENKKDERKEGNHVGQFVQGGKNGCLM